MMTTGGTTTRHDNGDAQHDNGDGRHDNGRLLDIKRQHNIRRHNDGDWRHNGGDGRHDTGSRATGGTTMATSGTTTRQDEGDG